jgi:single-strand DNA-binding protein
VRKLNKVILIGRSTKDFELRYTPTGVAVAQGTIAVDRPVAKDKEKESDFINLVVWRQLAEVCANYIKKGHRFACEGRIQVRNYENNEGKKVYVTEVVIDRVEFLESKNGNSQNANNNSSQSYPFRDDGKPIDISDDDLPFN